MPRSRKTYPCIGEMTFKIEIRERSWDEPSSLEGFSKIEHRSPYPTNAKIMPSRGKAIFDGTNWVNQTTHKIYIRTPSFEITTNHVVHYNNRVFEIMETENIEELNRFMWLYCKEVGTYDNKFNR